jgi:rRNA processing protein Gar1
MTTIRVVRVQRQTNSEWEKALELTIDDEKGIIFDVFGNIVNNYINIGKFNKRKLKKTLDYFP